MGEERDSVWQTTQWAVGPPRASSHTRPHTSCGRASVKYHIKSKERRRDRDRRKESVWSTVREGKASWGV